MKPLLLLVRWTCVLTVSFLTAFVLMHFGRRTAWFKEHLYHQLLSGNADEKLHAASVLAGVGAEQQLLRGLQEPEAETHEMARRGLEHLWFYSAGSEAYQMMQSAYEASEADKGKEALEILDRLIRRYPGYAEGWNRRAAVLWKLGKYAKSMEDCRRTLKLNPNHYGAWQGLGVCQLEMGDVAEACRSLRAALRILPHDEATQRSLQQCQQLLRTFPPSRSAGKPADLL